MNDPSNIVAASNLFAEYVPRPVESTTVPLPDLVIRRSTPADLNALAAIAWQREGGTLLEHVVRFERHLAEHECRDDRLWLSALIGDEVVGFGRAGFFVPPDDAPANAAPAGFYLFGVTVHPQFRRRGIGHALTVERLRWIAKRADVAYYFANAQNRASIDLHARLGFVEMTRDFFVPGASFAGGVGILFRADLRCLDLLGETSTDTSSH